MCQFDQDDVEKATLGYVSSEIIRSSSEQFVASIPQDVRRSVSRELEDRVGVAVAQCLTSADFGFDSSMMLDEVFHD